MSEVMALYAGAIGLHGKVATGAKKLKNIRFKELLQVMKCKWEGNCVRSDVENYCGVPLEVQGQISVSCTTVM